MRLEAWRTARGLSIEDAARFLGTDPTSLRKFERGEPVGQRRLAERFSGRTGGLVSIEEMLFPNGVPPLVSLTADEAANRAARG